MLLFLAMRSACSTLLVSLAAAWAILARAEWRNDGSSLAWTRGDAVVWKFAFDPQEGKPHFAALSTGAGPSFAVVHPADHYWHYGLWFSWKLINGVNYWEEDGPAHRAEGATRWATPVVATRTARSAAVRLEHSYARADGRVDLVERRELRISAPGPDGGYTIDWTAHFVAGAAGAVLDRTPLLGEPDGKVNGGYGGLGFRVPAAPVALSILTPAGAVIRYESDRARPNSAAVACNFTAGSRDLGGVAIVNLATGPSGVAEIPWYLVNGDKMRFICAAILAPKPLSLAAGATLDLHYRIVVRASAWTPESLRAVAEADEK